jgi:signal transduction histidine kinase
MSPSPSDPLVVLEEAFARTAAVLQEVRDPAGRAARLAGILRVLWPASPVSACRLLVEGQAHAAVVRAENGADSPEPAPGPFPPDPPPGLRWVLAEVAATGPARGAVGLALPGGAGAEAETPLRRLLSAYGRELALLLDEGARRPERAAPEQAPAEQAWSADLGALAGPVTHEFNNFLNVVLLQVAVLEQEMPERRRGEFAVIRQQGKHVAELVRQWQQYRYRQQPALQAVDLNRVVRQVVEALATEPPAFGEPRLALAPAAGQAAPAGADILVGMELADGLPPVSGTTADLGRLVRFLVTAAGAAVTTLPGQVMVRTQAGGGEVLLRVEDNGPAVDPDLLPQFFEPLVLTREGPNRLELAACKTLAHRRLQGAIHAENRAEGGVAVVLTLRPAE